MEKDKSLLSVSRLSKLQVDFPYLVAPMVGISHVAFRELIRFYTPPPISPLLFTEMLSTKRIPGEKLDLAESLFTSVGETGLIPQLLGNDESFIAPSIEKLDRLHPWGYDINMGCPATQTLKHNWGVQLMGDRKLAAEVVSVTRKHSKKPLSVKLRAAMGREIDLDYLLDFTKAIEEAGADWITLHCRTQGQGHRGYARWDLVGEVAKNRKIPIVANGDIQTADEAVKLVDSGVDGAMIARAATARPWILWQIAYKKGMTSMPPPLTPEEEGREYFLSVLRFSCLVEKYFGDGDFGLKKVIFYVTQGSRWLPFGHGFYLGVKRCKSLVEIRDYVNDYLIQYPQPLTARTAL